ncbi:DNA-directed RNA polymerase specialized sigma24 family protein [Streptomyces canus]|uniref:DNA-directed RNA polymerase specialized sigma24 family protein n=1 Tax=Streptomyces canus TaxID=58343 RepID=A0AAW8FUG6_9ACTN|nr:sigma factor-like helix-turn-helix DNA-binding protein [Streptomyces canus]MDQ0913731.1 DNA-directed RNA polymerase specialized sigma24 family protein [Streptomyces canus]
MVSSGYTTPARVVLTHKDDVPVSAEVAARLARLFELHGDGLVRYLASRVGWDRYALAEDLAQQVWLDLAARPEQMERWESADEDAFGLLAHRGRQQVGMHLRLARNEREAVLSATAPGDDRDLVERLDALAAPCGDTTVCAVLELLGETEEPALPACYADAVAALPERQRRAVELICQGTGVQAAAAWMGIAPQSVRDHLARAAEALRPALGAPVPDEESGQLPAGYERVLGRLPALQQQVVRLRAAGLNNNQIGTRLGRNHGTVYKAYKGALRNLYRMVRDQAADPVPTPPPGAGVCARKCASGCYLRTARTGAQS